MFVPVLDYQCAKQLCLMLLNEVVPKNTEEFLEFKTFSDRLDSFYVGFLEKREELEVLRKVFKIIFCFLSCGV